MTLSKDISHVTTMGYHKLQNLLQVNNGVESKKKITVDVRSTSFTGINLRYVRGNYSQEGISVQKAITMNFLIASLHAPQRKTLEEHVQNIMKNDQSITEKKISILKSVANAAVNHYTQNTLSEETARGIVINMMQ